MQLPRSYYNITSFVGTLISGISLLLIIFLFLVSVLLDQGSSYLGLFIYILLPGFLILGLILIPIGMLIQHRKNKKGEGDKAPAMLKLDLNDPTHRNGFYIFIVGTVILLLLSGIGSYEAYHYTESVEFCGTMCHKVMNPEYTTFQNSPHARVACVECHVGSGASWYVKSKLSGLYQVYSVIFNKYPRPIPTPVTSLRPARETCEECHWPQKFYSPRFTYEKHYLSDTVNTEWNIQLKMKISASHKAEGLAEGIHWHINPDVKIEYFASSPDRENIPLVRKINLVTGDTTVFVDSNDPVDADTINTSELRVMDCMDCHNRPSHNYDIPSNFIDEGIASGEIPVELPNIKLEAMEMLKVSYPTTDTALMMIEQGIKSYYAENFPEISAEKSDEIDQAIKGIKAGYINNIFPEMKASWDVYPDHIGHKVYNGCFRCHNDTHESKTGEVISKDCNTCHSILLQGTPGNLEVAPFNEELEFIHPVDIGGAEKEVLCTECHRYLYL